ncbi:hypothetical protein ASS95_01510 [Staphylococcus equorum]|uniref:hypothetical protein n=1 Tax=Staphylococcus equorum TaxID=246432 RepID=UPI000852A62F|nr:hypothetical protein [Staphylococcus equorum]OEK55462.1 hypothetical protein ASS95_01510 [Staphylococcus equorum]
MTNIRPRVVTKGKVLVEMAHYGGKLSAYRNIVDLICEKKDEVENNSEAYVVLNSLLNQVSEDYNDASVKEVSAKFKLDEILEQEKASSENFGERSDNA